MFKTMVANSPFVNDTANAFFQDKIDGNTFAGDSSFIATLRALVTPRIGDDTLRVQFENNSYTADQISSRPARYMTEQLCRYLDLTAGNIIYVQNIMGVQEDTYACLELLKSTFTEVYDDWSRLDKVTDFFRKQFYTLCFINPDHKSVVLFVDNMDIRKMHYLQCAIFAFLPWYFDPEQGCSELEMSLIESLRLKTSTQYEAVLEQMASQYDFRTAKIRNLLAGFEQQYERQECERTRNDMLACIERINSLNRQIGDYLNEKYTIETKLFGLEKKLAEGAEDSEIMEYFLCNDNLVLVNVAGDRLLFGVRTYVEYFDEDMVESMLKNPHSYVYIAGNVPAESMERLIRAIFIDQTLKLRFCAAYKLTLTGNVSPQQHFDFDNEFNGYMPNPHIDKYQCMGNYLLTINNLLKDRNYIGVIEQCVASCKSLNFGDSTVMEEFFSKMHRGRRRCIELPDGTVVTPTAAIEWLSKEEGTNNE